MLQGRKEVALLDRGLAGWKEGRKAVRLMAEGWKEDGGGFKNTRQQKRQPLRAALSGLDG